MLLFFFGVGDCVLVVFLDIMDDDDDGVVVVVDDDDVDCFCGASTESCQRVFQLLSLLLTVKRMRVLLLLLLFIMMMLIVFVMPSTGHGHCIA